MQQTHLHGHSNHKYFCTQVRVFSEYYGSCMTLLMVDSDKQKELQAIVDRLNVVWNTWTKWTMDNMLSVFKHFDQLRH